MKLNLRFTGLMMGGLMLMALFVLAYSGSMTVNNIFAGTGDFTGNVNVSTLTATGNIYMADDKYIGISGAEYILFDTAGDISFNDANVGIGTTAPYSIVDIVSSQDGSYIPLPPRKLVVDALLLNISGFNDQDESAMAEITIYDSNNLETVKYFAGCTYESGALYSNTSLIFGDNSHNEITTTTGTDWCVISYNEIGVSKAKLWGTLTLFKRSGLTIEANGFA